MKVQNYKFFKVTREGPVLLGLPDIKLLNILRITYKVISDPCERRKFKSQIVEASNSPSSRTNRAPWNKTDKAGTHDNNINVQIISGPVQTKQQTEEQLRY